MSSRAGVPTMVTLGYGCAPRVELSMPSCMSVPSGIIVLQQNRRSKMTQRKKKVGNRAEARRKPVQRPGAKVVAKAGRKTGKAATGRPADPRSVAGYVREALSHDPKASPTLLARIATGKFRREVKPTYVSWLKWKFAA
ncbi:MAG: hypothetical protein KGL39_28210 [Patescibacteria group bacterium]|nr:hypothetical protein [Patescibacteria group bacterium]